MQHLDAERLAALIDEAPTDEERMHLGSCGACRNERDAFVALSALALDAGRAPVGSDAPRLTDWNSLSAQLRAEGLITGEPVTAEHPVPVVVRSISGGVRTEAVLATATVANDERPGTRTPVRVRAWSLLPAPWLQIAAALTLMLGGLAVGRVSAGAPMMPVMASAPTINTGTVVPDVFGNNGFSSVTDATAALSRAQNEYQRASLWLADHDTTVTPELYRKRLAALDQLTETTREILHLAPQDQVLRSYYQQTIRAREATLLQLSSVLPVDKALERF